MVEELSGVQRSKDAYSGVFIRPSFFVDYGIKGKSVQMMKYILHSWPNSTFLNKKSPMRNVTNVLYEHMPFPVTFPEVT